MANAGVAAAFAAALTGLVLGIPSAFAATATPVKDIYPGAKGSGRDPTSPVSPSATLNGAYFIDATDGAHGYELWRSDGTNAGTKLVKDVAAGAADSHPSWLTPVNDVLYFTAIRSTPN